MLHIIFLSILAVLPSTSMVLREPEEAWNITTSREASSNGTVRKSSEFYIDNCVELRERNLKQFKMTILTNRVCIFLSMVSILVLIILHVVIEDLRVLNFTKLKIPFLIFLFYTFIFLVIKNNINFSATPNYAVFLGLVTQYFSLGIFFWLTSMSLDIWLTFRRIANPIQNEEEKKAVQTMKIRCYYIFSLGGPAIISFVTGVIQLSFTPEELPYFHPR